MSDVNQEERLRVFGKAVDLIGDLDGVVVLEQEAGVQLDANNRWTEGTITIVAKKELVEGESNE